MSFILDALKKSESDRQQQSAPDMSAVPTGAARVTVPRWLWWLMALLVVNLVVLTVVLIKPATVAGNVPAIATPAPIARELPQVTRPATGLGESVPIGTEDTAPSIAQLPAPVMAPPPVAQRASPAETQLQLTFNDIRANGDLTLPDLNIDIHVYSAQPADRFVFINMNQYRENATLVEGPLLREITTEGAILEYAGNVFLLPRD
jgi:general secretion pathway protein B